MLAKPWRHLFLPSGINLVVAAVLRDSLYVVSLLPCMEDCVLYTVCKVEWFVLTIIKQRLLLLLMIFCFVFRHLASYFDVSC